jgi:hypothetical protein
MGRLDRRLQWHRRASVEYLYEGYRWPKAESDRVCGNGQEAVSAEGSEVLEDYSAEHWDHANNHY